MKTKYKSLYVLAILLIVVATVVFGWLPTYVEKSRNRIQLNQHVGISSETQKLHQSLFIVDLHSDSLFGIEI